MAFVVEDGTARADATSYLSVADADDLLSIYNNATWNAATTVDKERYLQIATQYLDLRYGDRLDGYKVDSNVQALLWPRYGMMDLDGWVLDHEVLPSRLKQATAEAALRRATFGPLMPDDTEQQGKLAAESTKVGPITVSQEFLGGRGESVKFAKIDSLLLPFLHSNARLVRH